MKHNPNSRKDFDTDGEDPESSELDLKQRVKDYRLYGSSPNEGNEYSAFIIGPGVYLMRTMGRIVERNTDPEYLPPKDEEPTVHVSLTFGESYDDHLLDTFPSQDLGDCVEKDRGDIDEAYLLGPVKGMLLMHSNGQRFFYPGAKPMNYDSDRIDPMDMEWEVTDMLIACEEEKNK